MGGDEARLGTAVIAAEVLALLCCPQTRQPLGVASPEIVARLEALRVAGNLRDQAGNLCAEPIVGGLVRADGQRFFPIRGGIPVLLDSESVALPAMTS